MMKAHSMVQRAVLRKRIYYQHVECHYPSINPIHKGYLSQTFESLFEESLKLCIIYSQIVRANFLTLF